MENIITEQCGAIWIYQETGLSGERAYWLYRANYLDDGAYSVAKPHIVGFYAANLIEAANELSN
jgi:hypothetical protein